MTSYVIQNFFYPTSLVVLTPKFKIASLYLFAEKIFFMYNANIFFEFLTRLPEFFVLSPFFQFKNLFKKNLFSCFYQILPSFKISYVNALQKSLIFWNVVNFNKSLMNKNFDLQVTLDEELTFNHYFLSVKVALFEINKKFYDKVFFLFFFLDLNFWSTYTQSFTIYNNFLKLNYEIYNCYFISSFFFNIYNY